MSNIELFLKNTPVVYPGRMLPNANARPCRFPWDGATNEDLWFAFRAADIYDELPDNIKPATSEEAGQFAFETMYQGPPFGSHQYWCREGPSPMMAEFLEICPEALAILPANIPANAGWEDMLCSLDVMEYAKNSYNVSFDVGATCAL